MTPPDRPACRLRGGLCTCPVNECAMAVPVTRTAGDTVPPDRPAPTDILADAFAAHTKGHDKFTRRMAINIADLTGDTPKGVIQKLEARGLLKPGSWRWFEVNGGITKRHIKEARAT